MASWSQELERLLEDSCDDGEDDKFVEEMSWYPFNIEVVGELGSSSWITVTKPSMTVGELKQAYCAKVNKHHHLIISPTKN